MSSGLFQIKGQLLRVQFLDHESHSSAQQRYVPMFEALILTSHQQIRLGQQSCGQAL